VRRTCVFWFCIMRRVFSHRMATPKMRLCSCRYMCTIRGVQDPAAQGTTFTRGSESLEPCV
jgi:hypothetical protein